MRTVIDNHEFITYKAGDAEFVFSTSKNDFNFNKNLPIGINNLKKLCNYFNLQDVGYLNQTHSSIVNEYDKSVNTGDAIITDKKNIGIGIFTADCVPVLIYDKSKNIAAAVHSGWLGTSKQIAALTVKTLTQKYKCNAKDLVVYIGPHNRKCCYEFGYGQFLKSFSSDLYKNHDIYTGGKLDLEACIILQLETSGVLRENINTLNLCTFCNKDYEFYSYRREKNKNYGRLFSFIVIR